MHLGHNGQSCPSRGTLDDASMAGADEEEEQEEDLPENVSQIMGIKILLSLLTAMGFPSPDPMCSCPGSPQSHPTCSDMSVFSQCHPARLLHI